MEMNTKEQLLYFFLQGKISLSQYDYKFMANLQSMIQNKNRVTSNQATLFDNLISKYNKQLTKNGLNKEELKALPWKTLVVESTEEYTGAYVYLENDSLYIRVPFNKNFITEFRNTKNNTFSWDNESKLYSAKFSTTALKVAHEVLPKFFTSVRYCKSLSNVLDELKAYANHVFNPTLYKVHDRFVVVACNATLAEQLEHVTLSLDFRTVFQLSMLGIKIDESLLTDELRFASDRVATMEITDVEKALEYMKRLGCTDVIIGRGLRNVVNANAIISIAERLNMNIIQGIANSLKATSDPQLTSNVMMLQHTSNIGMFEPAHVNKIVVLKDSRPIEVK